MASPLSARRSSLLPPSSTPPSIEPRSSSPAFIRSTLAAYREQLSHCPSTDAGIDEEEKEDEETRQRSIRASFREGLKHGIPARGEEASSAENGGRAGRRPSEREERENLEILRLIALHEEIASAWLPRRLMLRLYLAWFLWRSTLRMRGMLSVLGFVVEAAAAWFLLILVPAQLAFEIAVRFNWVYGIGYGLDAILLAPRIYHLGRFFVALSHHVAAHVDVRLMSGKLGVMRALQNHSATAERRASQGSTPSASPTRVRPSHEPLWSPSPERARQSAPSGAALAPPSPWRSGVVHWPAAVVVPWNVWEVGRTLPVLPYDVCLWGTSAQEAVPWVRVIRALVYWYTTIDRTAAGLERSPRVAFTAARVLRVVNFFILAAHWLGCLFFLACRQRGASHYASSVAHFQLFHAKGQVRRASAARHASDPTGAPHGTTEPAFLANACSGRFHRAQRRAWALHALYLLGLYDAHHYRPCGRHLRRRWQRYGPSTLHHVAHLSSCAVSLRSAVRLPALRRVSAWDPPCATRLTARPAICL